MPNLPPITAVVGANIAGFTSAMGDVSSQLSKIDREASKAFDGFAKVGDRLKDAGMGLTAAFTVPIVGIGTAAVATAGNFELSMNKIKAFSGAAAGDLKMLHDQALKLGADTQFSAQQAADAMVVFASAGFNATQTYAAMPGTLALAAAGQMEVGAAATLTKDILGQFQLAAGDSGHVADVLAQAASDASASLSEMGTTLAYAGPIAKGAGQSLEETTAAIVALDAAGIRGERAGTGLRGVLGSLVAPSKDAAKFMNQLGISVSDSEGKIRPLSDIMEQFRTKLSGVGSEAEKQKIIFEVFGREAGNAAQVLINTGGPALDKIQQKLIDSGGAADKMAKTINSGLNFAIDQLKGSVETAGIALGEALIPVVTRLVDMFTKFVNENLLPAIKWFSELSPSVQTGAIAFAAMLAAIGPLAIAIGGTISGITSIVGAFQTLSGALATGIDTIGKLTAGMGGLSIAIAAVGAAFVAWDILKDANSDLMTGTQNLAAIADALGLFKNAQDSAVPAVKNTTEAVKEQHYWTDLLGKVSAKLKEINWWDALRAAINPLKQISDSFLRLTEEIKKLLGVYPEMNDAAEAAAKKLQAQTLAQTKVSDAVLQQYAAVKKLTPTQAASNEAMGSATKAAGQLSGKSKELAGAIDSLGESKKRTKRETDALAASQKKFNDEILIEKMRLWGQEHNKLKTEIAKLQLTMEKAVATGQDWNTQLDANIEAALKLSNQASVLAGPNGVPKVTQAQLEAIDATKEWTQKIETLPLTFDDSLLECVESVNARTPGILSAWDTFTGDIGSSVKEAVGGMASALFDGDLSFGEKFKKMVDSIKSAFLNAFVKPIEDAISNLISGGISALLGGKGFGGILDSVKNIGKEIASVFSGAGGATEAVSGAVSGGGGAAGAGGSLASALVSTGIMGTIGAVGAAVGAVSGIIGNFQMRAMNKTLDLIEESTRYTAIATIGPAGIIDTLRTFLPPIKDFAEVNWFVFMSAFASLMSTVEQIRDIMVRSAETAAPRIQVTMSNISFGSTADIDYLMDQMGRRLRETGNTI